MFIWPCIVTNFFTIQTKRRTNFKISSGTKLYMFRAVSLPIIKSYPLYIRHWHMSYSFDDSLRAGTQAVVKTVWHKPVPNVQWLTPDNGRRNCPKHVEFRTRINLEISASDGFCCKEMLFCFQFGIELGFQQSWIQLKQKSLQVCKKRALLNWI